MTDRREEPATARDTLFDDVDQRFGRNVARFVDARVDAIEREALPAPLDVERLALAMTRVRRGGDELPGYWLLRPDDLADIAAEYARLSTQPSTEPAQGGER